MKINKTNMTVEPLFKNYKKTISIHLEDSEIVLVSKHNNAGLKKLSSFA
jgi:hypothetical protein